MIVLIFTVSLNAQGLIFKMHPNNKSNVFLSFSHPQIDIGFFGRSIETTTFSGNYQLDLNFAVSDKSMIHFGIPYIHGEFEDFGEAENGFGNLSLGFQSVLINNEKKKSAVQFIVYLPTVDNNNASGFGTFADATEVQAYVPDLLSLIGQYALVNKFQDNLYLNNYVGFLIAVPIEDNNNSDIELFLRYAVEPTVKAGNVNIFLLFQGVFLVTASNDDVEDFSDRFINKFGFGLSIDAGMFQPKFCYQVYTNDDLNDLVDGIFTFGVNYYF